MIENYVKEIEQKLEMIKKEHDDTIKDLIDYETSKELCVGGMLCRYGEMYKIIFNATSNDDAIEKLEKLYNRDEFETYIDDVKRIQNIFINGVKKGLDFDLGTRMDALTKLEHDYMLDIILTRL